MYAHKHLSIPFFSFLFAGLALLSSCTSFPQPPVASSETSPTPAASEQTRMIGSSTSTPQSQPTIHCNQPGKVSLADFFSTKLGARLVFNVYFPPCYENDPKADFPALYLLHGQTYDQTQWQNLGIQVYADQMIQSGRVSPFLIIMPNEQFHFRSPDGNQFPFAILEELIPWVETSLHARPQKNWRAIGGISRGASWAIRLALQNPSYFGAVGAHSLPTFNGDLKQLPDWLDKIPPGQLPRIYLDIGNLDPEVQSASQFEQVLTRLGVSHQWHLNEGRHNEDYWRQHIQEYLDWYTLNWKSSAG
jgi:enterochelin esterase-like enzyme